MAGAVLLGEAISARTGFPAMRVGQSEPPLGRAWNRELAEARSGLHRLASSLDRLLDKGWRPITTMGRCACALATLPVLARHRPDALVVWFDAHGDVHTPRTTSSGYLGGMVITGAAGLWETGLGAGLRLADVILAGTRDIDQGERALLDEGSPRIVAPGARFAERLAEAIADRPVYVHIDCDVLEPGIVPTEYEVPGGLTLGDLGAACEAMARNEVVGLEVAEYESTWPDGRLGLTRGLIDALDPLFGSMAHLSRRAS
jgi:arginase